MAITNPARPGQINDAGYWTARSNWNGDQMPGMPPGFVSGATTVPGDLGGDAGKYGFQYLAPLPQSFTGIPYNQGDTSGNLVNGGYNNLMDQIQDSLRMPSTYAQSWPWNNGAGRYAFGSGQPYNPNAGRMAPWDVGTRPPVGGGLPPPGPGPTPGPTPGPQPGPAPTPPGSIPGVPFRPPTPGNLSPGSSFPPQQLDPATIPPPYAFGSNPPGYIDPSTATPMPKTQPRLTDSFTQGIPAKVLPLTPSTNYGTSASHPLGASATNDQTLATGPKIGNSYGEYVNAYKSWYAGLPTSERIVDSMNGGNGPMSEAAWNAQYANERAHPFVFPR